MEEKVYTTPHVAKHLQLSKSKLHYPVQNEKTPYFRIRRNAQLNEVDFKVDKAEGYTRFKNGSQRLKQAIDFLLDYIIEIEGMSQCDSKKSELQNTEPPSRIN